jgi:hypothetical protein
MAVCEKGSLAVKGFWTMEMGSPRWAAILGGEKRFFVRERV